MGVEHAPTGALTRMTQVANAPATEASDAANPNRHRGRRIAATTLIVISCVLAPISVMSIWLRNQVLNTNRYVATVAPLATNPHVIDTAATGITNTLFSKVDVESEIKDALPSRASFLATPVSQGLHDLIQRVALQALQSKQFATIWKEANRRAHAQLNKALTGGGKVVSTANGKIVIDLAPIVEQVRLELKQRGVGVFDRIPIDQLALKYEVADAHSLKSAQRATRALNTLSYALPILMLLTLGGGLWCSVDRRRTLAHWGIGVAFAVAFLGLLVTIGRALYLNAVTTPALPQATAAAVFDTIVRYLRDGIRLVAVIGLLVAIVAWLIGPSRSAVRVRATARRITSGSGETLGGHGWNFGGFGRWVHAHARALDLVGVGAALVAFLLWDLPTARTVIGLVVLLVLYLGVIEIISRAATAEDEGTTSPDALGASQP
jgi:hypothetical protein